VDGTASRWRGRQMYAPHANVSGSDSIAILSGRLSSSRPSSATDHRSPNTWIDRIDAAIALARRSAGTARSTVALTGAVVANRQIWTKNDTAKKAFAPGRKNPIADSGAAIAIATAAMRSSALTASLLPSES